MRVLKFRRVNKSFPLTCPINPEALDILSDVALRHYSERAGKADDARLLMMLRLVRQRIVVGSSIRDFKNTSMKNFGFNFVSDVALILASQSYVIS